MKMKKIITMMLAVGCMLTAAQAQRPHREGPRPEPRPDITEMVSDLTASQKSKLETIAKESKERLEKLHKQKRAVRDSIEMYMEKEGDHSKELYPLFDREEKLNTLIQREMYATKMRFDQVLTADQRKELADRNKRHQNKKKSVQKR